ncbi:MAG: purine phosphorylase [Sphingorhabdus sp.]
MAAKTLILAALPEEADAVYPSFGIRFAYGPFGIRKIDNLIVATCGLGKVNAALAVGMLADNDIRLIVMTGTCGRIDKIEGDCFWITRAIQHDYGARRSDGFAHYRAGDWPMGEGRDAAFSAIPDPGLGLPPATIISGDVFLECSATAAILANRLNAQLVDMEVAAVAQAATILGLPWAAIKAVTDGADGESADSFSTNLKRAARKAAEATERLVATLPLG